MMLFLGSMALGLGRTEGWVGGVTGMFCGMMMLAFAMIHRRIRGSNGSHEDEGGIDLKIKKAVESEPQSADPEDLFEMVRTCVRASERAESAKQHGALFAMTGP